MNAAAVSASVVHRTSMARAADSQPQPQIEVCVPASEEFALQDTLRLLAAKAESTMIGLLSWPVHIQEFSRFHGGVLLELRTARPSEQNVAMGILLEVRNFRFELAGMSVQLFYDAERTGLFVIESAFNRAFLAAALSAEDAVNKARSASLHPASGVDRELYLSRLRSAQKW